MGGFGAMLNFAFYDILGSDGHFWDHNHIWELFDNIHFDDPDPISAVVPSDRRLAESPEYFDIYAGQDILTILAVMIGILPGIIACFYFLPLVVHTFYKTCP